MEVPSLTSLFFCLCMIALTRAAAFLNSYRLESFYNKEFSLRQNYGTFACERTPLRLSCSESRKISIVRAHYGRQEWSHCNPELREKDESVYCPYVDVIGTLHRQCGGKTECSVFVNNRNFAKDPCPGVYKLVEVMYNCNADEE